MHSVISLPDVMSYDNILVVFIAEQILFNG